MRTIFLDFDGVLHPEHCHESRHFCCLPVFEQVLRRTPGWEVVIASTWRFQFPLDDLRARFSPDLVHRIVGVTAKFSQLENVPESLQAFEREAECIAWLRANERVVFPWLAIDDRSWLYRPFNSFLFLVDGKTGMTAANAEELIWRLNGI
jgi:hypothetical protein